MSLKLAAFKPLAQRFHFTGQHPLVQARSPLGHHAALSQAAAFGWTTQSFSQRSFPLLLLPLGRQPIALPNSFSPSAARTAPDRPAASDRFADAPLRQPVQSADAAAPIQSQPDTTETAVDRPPNSATPTIQPQPASVPASASASPPEHAARSPTHSAPTHPAAPTLEPQIALKSEEHQFPPAAIDRPQTEHNRTSPPSDPVQRQPEAAAQQDHSSDDSRSSAQPSAAPPARLPNAPETATVQPRLEDSSTAAIASAPPQPAIAPPAPAKTAPPKPNAALTLPEDAATITTAGDRSSNQAAAFTAAPPAVQMQPIAEAVRADAEAKQGDQGAERAAPHSACTAAIVQRQPEFPSPSPAAPPRPDSAASQTIAPQQPEVAPAKLDPHQTSSAAPTPSTAADRPADSPPAQSAADAIVQRSPHHDALLLKPLGFTQTLVQPAELPRSTQNAETSTPADRRAAIAPPTSEPLQRRAEAPQATPLASEDDSALAKTAIQAPSDSIASAAPSQAIQSDPPASTSTQRQPDRSHASIESTAAIAAKTVPEQRAVSFDPNASQSNRSVSSPTHPAESWGAEPNELSELGEQLAIAASADERTAAASPANSRSVSLRSPASADRAKPAKPLEQQLETLAYPVYYLIRQRWQIEQERQHSFWGGYPSWSRDLRLSNIERAPQKTSRTALLELPNPSSPLQQKLQLLTQQVYGLVQWQWAIEQERDGHRANPGL